jgi:hypothetical protein
MEEIMEEVSVRIIMRKKRVLLVEAVVDGVLQRVVVPDVDVTILPGDQEGVMKYEAFVQGLQYGIPWDLLLSPVEISPEKLSELLHKSGIWTEEDVKRDPKTVQGVLLSALQHTMQEINQIVKSQAQKEN